ncbi:hypothetical protein ACFJIW_24035 [Tahibacter sp. UC22_41]|uniref:hypothetical protein n=1 Tax=Tahibacter sp. UC22_41 TaxID=3350178 RepID=UPI0036D81F87
MEFRDVVLVLSFLLSMISFVVSLRSSEFTKRVKLIEMRNGALFKMVELRVLLDRVEDHYRDLAALPRAASNSRFPEIYPKIERFRRHLSAMERDYRSSDFSAELNFQKRYMAEIHLAQKGGEEIERLIKLLIEDTKKASGDS